MYSEPKHIAAGVENRKTSPISYYEYIEGAEIIKSCPKENEERFGLVAAACEISIGQE